MNDSGLWKRGIFLLILVGAIAGVALFVALRRPDVAENAAAPIAPELLTPMLYTPALAAVAPFPASINWGALQQIAQSAPSAKGWEIRYNAALALARKGEANLPFEVLLEMLDEKQQQLNAATLLKDGRLGVNEADARQRVYVTLQVVSQWYKHPERKKKFSALNAELRKTYEDGLARINQAVDQLAQNSNPALRTEALKTLQILRDQ